MCSIGMLVQKSNFIGLMSTFGPRGVSYMTHGDFRALPDYRNISSVREDGGLCNLLDINNEPSNHYCSRAWTFSMNGPSMEIVKPSIIVRGFFSTGESSKCGRMDENSATNS
jgi:hypothetical protein